MLCFFTISGKSSADYKRSDFLQRDCSNTSQFCELTLDLKNEPIDKKSVLLNKCAWHAATCGISFTLWNAPEVSSSKSRISLSE